MTNTIAAIVVLVATNWTSIGTFTDHTKQVFDVQQGQRMTNTVAIIEYEGQKYEFTLKSLPGDVVGERRDPCPSIIFTPYLTNSWLPGKMLTNSPGK